VLLPLDDSVEVYPGHGAGSMCGRAMSAKTASTIGFERRFNPALQFRDKASFVAFLMEGVPPKPPSFDTIVAKNRGLLPLAAAKPRPFTAREAWPAVGAGACVVDLREPGTFGEGHVPGAINVWIDGPQFAERVSWFVPAGAPVLLVPQGPSDVERATQALSRVGVDDVQGFLQWGMIDWRSEGLPVETVPQLTVHELEQWVEDGREVDVIDVREPAEWMEGHVGGAIHVPMLEAVRRREELAGPRAKAVVCAGGLRSSAVISALKRHGLANLYNVTGGMAAWIKAGYPIQRAS
jgi:rhodanese-related sulfurtransferase